MFRAIAQVSAKDVVVNSDKKVVKHFIPKSKTDQKGLGTWRTLKCCGKEECERSCPFSLAVQDLNDLGSAGGSSPLFPDSMGSRVSKIHMVTAWASWLDQDTSGHSARRSGAMAYARAGVSAHHIQFLGRWKSSAVFRYIEEAMTEIPLNVEPVTKEKEVKPRISEETRERKALRPKSKGSPKKSTEIEEAQELLAKPLVNEEEREEVYAISERQADETSCGPGSVGDTIRQMVYPMRMELCRAKCENVSPMQEVLQRQDRARRSQGSTGVGAGNVYIRLRSQKSLADLADGKKRSGLLQTEAN